MTTSGNPPTAIATNALSIFTETSYILAGFPQRQKSDCGAELAFLGLLGNPRRAPGGMPLHIRLHEGEIRKRSSLVDEAVSPRRIRHKSLGELFGALTFTQSSIFGRFGRTPVNPLYKKLYPNPYAEILTVDEVRILEWRDVPIRDTIPRIAEIKLHRSEILIYTDAAAEKSGASSAILAAVVTEPGLLASDGYPPSALTEKTDPFWETIFPTTAYS